MKYIIEITYDFPSNRIKFRKEHEVTSETSEYYECKSIGETFKKRDEEDVKSLIGNCYSGLKVWKSVMDTDGKYTDNKINCARWELVALIKDYLKAQIEEIEVC